ncbi:hypothetical protein GCM10009844_34660 [Nocardioides koreensis]|uniref:Lipoprotein n=1 Tax=Nocardioides koreensis TaxID=433651 RepID=A0ABP5LQH4_9ACTN
MRASRGFLAVSVLCLAASLTACSSDGDSEAGAAPSDKPRPTMTEEARTTCDVTVDVTGDVTASWKGEGFATTENTSGPPAFYQAADKGISVTLYSEGNGFEAPSAVVTVKKTTYTTQPDASGVEVDDAGKGGQVDADAEGIAPDAKVHLKTEFAC